MPTNNQPIENQDATQDPMMVDDDAVGVRAPNLADPEDSAKGDDVMELDDPYIDDELDDVDDDDDEFDELEDTEQA